MADEVSAADGISQRSVILKAACGKVSIQEMLEAIATGELLIIPRPKPKRSKAKLDSQSGM